MQKGKWFIFGMMLCFSLQIFSERVVVNMYRTTKTGRGKTLGNVVATDTSYGLLIKPHLYGFRAGLHGFHVHTNPSCENYGKAAGGHFDPQNTQKHLGPYNNKGHLGDLPALYVDSEGKANLPILAPRLKVADLKNHALIIHDGGDNYSDKPKKLGGGGARFACGIVK